MAKSVVYLCSSARHAYLALGLANEQPECDHHLVLIGQKYSETNKTLDFYLALEHPFVSVDICQDQAGLLGKFQSKKVAFRDLENLVTRLKPEAIFAGNDRRVEFQYVMYVCRQKGFSTQGVYLDDGTASYVNGRYLKRWRTFTDLTFDYALKKIFYGGWYHKHRLMGGTRWVNRCHLNFPDLAPEPLKAEKEIVPLKPETFRASSFLNIAKGLLDIACDDSAQREALFSQRYDAFLLLPLSKFVDKHFPSREYYVEKVNDYLVRYSSVAVKYHPRETDFYYSGNAAQTLFPAMVPAELLFSYIDVETVVGDLSSALLSAVWLLPQSRAVCLCPDELKNSPIVSLIRRTPVEITYC